MKKDMQSKIYPGLVTKESVVKFVPYTEILRKIIKSEYSPNKYARTR